MSRMQIKLSSLLVENQAHALEFYTGVLGSVLTPLTAVFDDTCGNLIQIFELPA